ncbi:hypothetical protein CIB93_04465 [Streptomyces sp. WZ.A104]|uniref:hypothetical protein n=1 Tax=Streptomyces sp. WZ.A104 TaxID=2023771 RepID=UPI000BBC25FC|nr:hypothetical protein [Streptomyces sp. WZ.A104]PCG87106.1 hypothetical protein CIB93_04465 [Streptomyces sp. WZ.A104]
MSKVYDNLPSTITEAGENVLRAYAEGTAPTTDPGLLQTVEAMLFAEAAALEAVVLLTERHSSSSDLVFAELLEEPVFMDLAPTILSMLRFLRGRIAGHDPVLRLDPSTPQPALCFLLLAGQALVSAAADRPGTQPVRDALAECLHRLATAPAEERYPAGDLGFGLEDQQREEVDEETYLLDEVRKVLTESVPLRRVLTSVRGKGGAAFLTVDLAARPDVADLLRMLATDPPAGGADTSTRWRAFAAPAATLIRLEIEWLQPVNTTLALVLDVDEYAPALEALTHSDHVQLSATDPVGQPRDAVIHSVKIPTNGPELRHLLAEAARRRQD